MDLLAAIEQIKPVFIVFVRDCFKAHIRDNLTYRDTLLELIDMCVRSLFRLEINPRVLEDIIVSLGFRYFPHNFIQIEWYLDKILPAPYEYISLEETEDSTVCEEGEEEDNI